ncbi:MAG: carotenoid 1,2-hydratase [Actinobacteria bacterium]|nr:carotenoid 1,2-hydratase [Actinomycetota bacterium]
MRIRDAALGLALAAVVASACATPFAPLAAPAASTVEVAALPPITLPADEIPHANLTEWWYFTGHLRTDDGRPFGFEFVIFQSVRGSAPAGYAAHFALTDRDGRQFRFDQKSSAAHGAAVGEGLDLAVGDWHLRRAAGEFRVQASTDGAAIDLALTPTKPAVLHNSTGVLDFSPYGWSYYYSYTRLAVTGTLRTDALTRPVRGQAWFDHQWGDFISVGSGGWDWFSLQLDDGRDFTASLVRAADGAVILTYGTMVDRDGRARHLRAGEFEVRPRGTWTSPASCATYPSGWDLTIASDRIAVTLSPVLLDQELDARASVGVVYWEGAVDATAAGVLVGVGYVELTGYATAPPPTAAGGAGPSRPAACA